VELYRAAVALTRQARFVPGLAQSLRMLGEVLLGLDRRAEARENLQEAVTLFAQLRDRDGEATVWRRLAGAHEGDDQHAEAMAAWAKVRALRQQAGDASGAMEALEGLGRAARRHLAEPSLALGYYREAAALAATMGDVRAEGRLRNSIGIVEWGRGEYGEALAQYERALELFRQLGDVAAQGLMLNSLGATLKALGRLPAARERLHEALHLLRGAAQPQLEGHSLALLGEIALELDEWRDALSFLDASLEIRRRLGDRRGEGRMLQLLARAHAAGDHRDRARDAVTIAERLAVACDDTDLLASCRELRRSAGL
jgi:tetratricopeptide (TPR) repeat protein